MAWSYLYQDDNGGPLKSCPACGHDLTQEDGVDITLSIGGRVFDVESRLDENGKLIDTDDNAVAAGFHSATLCGGCGDMLCDIAEEIQEAV